MSVRGFLTPLLVIAAALTSVVPAGAQEAPARPEVTISGTVTDLFGDAIEVCVFIRHAEVRYRPVTGLGEGQLTDPATGAYSFSLPQGIYDLWAYDPIHSPYADGPCPDPNPWNRVNTETFELQGPRRVTTLEDQVVDFELAYRLMGGTIDDDGCCGATASAPGGEVGLRAWTGRALRDRARVYWRDTTGGAVVELPWDQPLTWNQLYDFYGCFPSYRACGASPPTTFTMPSAHGEYPYEMWAEAPDGTVVSEVRRGSAWVDTVAPTIERVEPPEGGNAVYADAVRLELDGHDDGPRIIGVQVAIADADDPGTPVKVIGLDDGNFDGSWWWGWARNLEPERTYIATFTATDRAGNSTSTSSTFYARTPPPDDCDLTCRAPYLIEAGKRLVQDAAG